MDRRSFLLSAAALLAARWSEGARAAPLSMPLAFDDGRRPLVQTRINGRGPYAFVLDTAAQQVGLGPRVVADARLTPDGREAMLHGAAGAARVPLYTLATVELETLRLENVTALELRHTAGDEHGHDGILSPAVFGAARLTFEYPARRLTIDRSPDRTAGEADLPVDILHNVFVIAPAQVQGVAVRAVIDTGARHSMANDRLREALGFAPQDPRFKRTSRVGGATGQSLELSWTSVAGVAIGGLRLTNLELPFAAAPVFAALGLAGVPAIIVGADILHASARFGIDYASRRFSIAP